MKNLFLSLFTLMGMQLFAQDVVLNDANAQKRTLSGSFTAIQVSDGIELLLSKSNEESIAVSASETKYLERLVTEVDGKTLKIYFDKKGMVWNGNERRRLKAYVSFKLIDKLLANSGATIKCKNLLTLAVLDLKLTSGAQFEGEVSIGQLTTDQNSGSKINLTGKVESLKAEVSSGAIFKGFELQTEFCEAKASSGGGIRITVNKELNAKASSGGGIRYKGNGIIKEVDVNSGGLVKRA